MGSDNSESLVGGSGCDQDIVDSVSQLPSAFGFLSGNDTPSTTTPTGNRASLIGDVGTSTCTATVPTGGSLTAPCGQYIVGANNNTLTSVGPEMLQIVAGLNGPGADGNVLEATGSNDTELVSDCGVDFLFAHCAGFTTDSNTLIATGTGIDLTVNLGSNSDTIKATGRNITASANFASGDTLTVIGSNDNVLLANFTTGTPVANDDIEVIGNGIDITCTDSGDRSAVGPLIITSSTQAC
jgi:hypothetical protein